ncbi:hypothetical protein P4O66_002125 [Electrophorus voltai]|uniref:S1 motif domain-containing protein n=1 Tax=Electrophorus voltai TaxID=2609070 RepID=A0AAD9DTF3_9TELE|nr:hypothetical protein P4O66_002125 [Electrophorus voltai]
MRGRRRRGATAPGRAGVGGALQLQASCRASLQVTLLLQTLAINRGENLKILTVKVNIPDWVKTDFCRWCVNVRTKLTTSAEKESVSMFVRNLRQRLLLCPVRGRAIMGVDPGYRHGCKLAILSPISKSPLHHRALPPRTACRFGTPTRPSDGVSLMEDAGDWPSRCDVQCWLCCQTIVIGNGTACRETEAFFADLIKCGFFKPLEVSYCITSEAGASIYSVSPEAVKEMPDLDPNLRSAVSIGRRVQDPLAELVKIDPKHIGIGTYQHDVSQSLLRAALDGVVQECVSFVGVDINICSETLMRHVAGLNAARARGIVQWREKNGPFLNREQLKLVKGLGPKSFQQCAGFVRINPESVRSHGSGGDPDSAPAKTPAAKKSKSKSSAGVSNQPNPLDQTCIHPESYSVAMRFLSQIGGGLEELGSAQLRQRVECCVGNRGLEPLAQSLNTCPETLQLIVDGLTQPPGFDIRQDFEKADFKQGIVSMSDLHTGTVLTGRVENTALFGAFVDIGVGRSGLIPKRYITPDKLPADQRCRNLALGPGERVEVRVLDVDIQRSRITLDLIRVILHSCSCVKSGRCSVWYLWLQQRSMCSTVQSAGIEPESSTIEFYELAVHLEGKTTLLSFPLEQYRKACVCARNGPREQAAPQLGASAVLSAQLGPRPSAYAPGPRSRVKLWKPVGAGHLDRDLHSRSVGNANLVLHSFKVTPVRTCAGYAVGLYRTGAPGRCSVTVPMWLKSVSGRDSLVFAAPFQASSLGAQLGGQTNSCGISGYRHHGPVTRGMFSIGLEAVTVTSDQLAGLEYASVLYVHREPERLPPAPGLPAGSEQLCERSCGFWAALGRLAHSFY